MPSPKKITEKWLLRPDDASTQTVILELQNQWTDFKEVPLPEIDATIKSIKIDTQKLGKWNTSLPAFLYQLALFCQNRNILLDTKELPTGAQQLLDLSTATKPQKRHVAVPKPFLQRTGEGTITVFQSCLVGLEFTGSILFALKKLFQGKARMRWQDVYTEILKAGPDALFIVSLISFLMGLILAFIGSIPLKWFQVEIYVASLIGIGMFRLMGAVMAGVVMAGRTGAAYAAELGTMQVNEEIDALESMDIPPIEFLVLPRIIALTLMLPVLCVYAGVVGVLGGLTVAVYYLDLSPLEYCSHLISTTPPSNIIIGCITSFIFGILIAICGCLRGLRCGRSADAVGQATTSAMVSSIICLVVATSIITVVTVFMGY